MWQAHLTCMSPLTTGSRQRGSRHLYSSAVHTHDNAKGPSPPTTKHLRALIHTWGTTTRTVPRRPVSAPCPPPSSGGPQRPRKSGGTSRPSGGRAGGLLQALRQPGSKKLPCTYSVQRLTGGAGSARRCCVQCRDARLSRAAEKAARKPPPSVRWAGGAGCVASRGALRNLARCCTVGSSSSSITWGSAWGSSCWPVGRHCIHACNVDAADVPLSLVGAGWRAAWLVDVSATARGVLPVSLYPWPAS